MAMTLPTAEDLFEETVRKVSSTPQEWLKFLNTTTCKGGVKRCMCEAR